MSTTHPSTGTPPLHYLASPENVRSIFFTNLVLLGVHDYSSVYAHKPESHHHLVETAAATAYHGLNESRFGTSVTSFEPQSMTRSVSRPQQRLQQPIIIDSCGYDVSGNARPLELHRHVFVKGHQSTKALEFILWFLFVRLDTSLARDRFKECWPVLDRHDAREFRNVAFKWLEELRKDGCFGVGHQLTRDYSSATSSNAINITSSSTGGLGLFLPTIRRSYLDESIGERIEQLVLVLSTYVLSTAIKKERQLQEEDNRTLLDLISHAPESSQNEARLLEAIDSQIVRQSQSFFRDIEKQKAVRTDWRLKSQEMCYRLDTLSRELTNVESERRMFLVHQPHIADRTGLLSLEELRVLEDRWIEKINDQWRPILSFVERHVGRTDVLRALLDADSGSGASVLDGKRLQKDLPMTLDHLANHDKHGSPSVDVVSILKTWKRSLVQLESRTKQDGNEQEALAAVSRDSLENLSRSHAKQLKAIKGTRTRLESRLNEVTQRVEMLRREKKIQERPYRRLLSAITTAVGQEGDSFGASPPVPKDVRKEADETVVTVFSALTPSSPKNTPSSTRQSDIRNHIRASASELSGKQPSNHRSLLESYRGQDISDVLLIRAPVIVVPKPSRSPVQPSRTDPFKSLATTSKPVTPKPIAFKPITTAPYTTMAAETSTPAVAISARSTRNMSSSVTKPPASFALSRNEEAESRAFPRKRSLAKEPIIKPVPEDLVVRESTGVSQPYETECKEIVALLTEGSADSATPPVTTLNGKRATRPIKKTAQNITAQTISPNSKRTALWSSLFQGRDLGSRTGTISDPSIGLAKLIEPINHQPAQLTERFLDTSSNRTQSLHQSQEPTPSPPTIPSTRSIFRGRLGVSRKRRQSSDFQPGRSTTPLQPVLDEPQETLLRQKDVIQPTKADNTFQESNDEPPGTPSKRRRTDSVLGRRTSYVYGAELTTKDDPNHQPMNPVSKTPDRSALLKALRSPKLTLDDLRAPTPKPVKTKSSESMAMPLMLLHTPQQKLLYQMEAGLIPKVTNPFTSLTPSSVMDPKSKSTFLSPTSSPFKRPAFSPSIFARFKSNPGPEQPVDTSPADQPAQTPTRPSLWDPTSPFAPTSTPVKFAGTPPAAPVLTKSMNKSMDRKPLTTTSILKHLLNGNSVVLDRMCDKADNSPSDKNIAPLPTAVTTTPPATSPFVATTSATTPSAPARTAKKQPTVQTQGQEHKDIVSTRLLTSENKNFKINKATIPSISDESAAVTSLKVKQNPWGRPPSWTPNQPLMIDESMGARPQFGQGRWLAAKSAGIDIPLSGSLAKTSMGSLKVSVFGRPKHGSALPLSPVSASNASLLSFSSRSFLSNSSLPSSVSGHATTQENVLKEDEVLDEEEEDYDDPDNDTRGFSSPAVSPIRGSDLDMYESFAESSMMMSTRRTENERSRFHISNRSARRQCSVSVHADEPNEVESIVAELPLNQEQEAERRLFLDEPMPEYEDGDRGGGEGLANPEEDETVMNYALQPIFGGSRGSRTEGGSRRSLSNSSIPRFFSSRGSVESADLLSSDARLSHVSPDGHVSERVGRSDKEEGGGGGEEGRRDGMEEGEEEGMMVGGLFDEKMPAGLDPNEVLWENTELFS